MRLHIEVQKKLVEASNRSGRSLNAEIAYRLEQSLDEDAKVNKEKYPMEKQKLELLLDYEDWYVNYRPDLDFKSSMREYCSIYNGEKSDRDGVDFVFGVDRIDTKSLKDLVASYRRYARESRLVDYFRNPTEPQRLAPEERKCEILLAYFSWIERTGNEALGDDSLKNFCEEYNSSNSKVVLELREIYPSYLHELVIAWIGVFFVGVANFKDSDVISLVLKNIRISNEDKLKMINQALKYWKSFVAQTPPSSRAG